MTEEEYLARLGLLRLQSGKRKPQEPVPPGSSVLDVPIGGTQRIPDTVLRRPPKPEDAIKGLPEPSMAQRHAESLAGYLTPKIGGPRAQTVSQTLVGGGPESLLPFGMAAQEFVPFSPYVAEEAGRMVRSGVETDSPLEIGLGVGLGALQASPAALPLARGAKAVGKRVMEAADPEAIRQYVRQTQGLTGMPGTSVIKPKGGNWLTGDIEKQTERLKHQGVAVMPLNEEELADFARQGYTEFNPSSGTYSKPDPLNNWIDKKLNKYIRNEMGTVEDPVRKLAEQNILHFEPQQVFGDAPSTLMRKRAGVGMPTPLFGQSEMARRWESLADRAIDPFPAGSYKYGSLDESFLASNPWLEKVPDEALVYKSKGLQRDMGFNHLIDELRNAISPNSDLPAHLRWKPEDLNKVTMAQAVERVAKINEYRAAKKEEANEVLARNPATIPFKDYETVPGTQEPNSKGLAWKQIKPVAMPEAFVPPDRYAIVRPTPSAETLAIRDNETGKYITTGLKSEEEAKRHLFETLNKKQLEEALKYEGDVMGHCVGGYCDDVLSGKSQIYSLRDKKGEPHVTIELKQPDVGRSFGALPDAERYAIAQEIKDKYFGGVMPGTREEDKFWSLIDKAYTDKYGTPPPEIVQIKGKANRAPKEEYLPFVQDFVRSGKWSNVGDLQNTGLFKVGDQYVSKEEVAPLIDKASRFIEETPALREHREAARALDNYRGPIPSAEYTQLQRAAGKAVHPTIPYTYRELRAILDDPEAFSDRSFHALGPNLERIERLRQLLGEQGYAKGGLVEDPSLDEMQVEMMERGFAGGGLAKKALKGAYKTLPLELPRAPAMSTQEIAETAERIARQQTGEHVRGKKGAQNLAGRSMKEQQRLAGLDYVLEATKTPAPEKVVPEKKGQVRVALPGDISVADKVLMEVEGLPIGVLQQGGPKYGAGKTDLPTPAFWASNIGPARMVQNKVDDLALTFETPEIFAQHMAMGDVGMNFAQHLAKANLVAINNSIPHPGAVEKFNEIIRRGFVDPASKEVVSFPNFPGVENVAESYRAMKRNPEMRKWFNNRMKVDDITQPLNFPSGKNVQYAIMEPELRDLEVGMSGLSVGRMMPGESLVPQTAHKTYSHDIPGLYVGRTQELLPVELGFPDATAFIASTKRPQDFTSTMQKVFPHQVVDEQYINQLGEYYDKLRKIRGFKDGGAVKPEGADEFAEQVMQKIANKQAGASYGD